MDGDGLAFDDGERGAKSRLPRTSVTRRHSRVGGIPTPVRHSRVGGNPASAKRQDGARRASSPSPPRRSALSAKAGTYPHRHSRESGNLPPPSFPRKRDTYPHRHSRVGGIPTPVRHSRVGGNPAGAKRQARARRAPSPSHPRRPALSAKAGTSYLLTAPRRTRGAARKREPPRPRIGHPPIARPPNPLYDGYMTTPIPTRARNGREEAAWRAIAQNRSLRLIWGSLRAHFGSFGAQNGSPQKRPEYGQHGKRMPLMTENDPVPRNEIGALLPDGAAPRAGCALARFASSAREGASARVAAARKRRAHLSTAPRPVRESGNLPPPSVIPA